MKNLFVTILLILVITVCWAEIVDYFPTDAQVSGDVTEQAKSLIGIYDKLTIDYVMILNAQKVYWNKGESIFIPTRNKKDIGIVKTEIYTIEQVCNLYQVTPEWLVKWNSGATYKTE